MNAKEILDSARGYVEKGWIQNELENEEGNAWCALGALCMAAFGNVMGWKILNINHEYIEAVGKFTTVIREDDPNGVGIALWNNDPNRTQEDVILAFKKAAYNCE